jgi:hypothetical protein
MRRTKDDLNDFDEYVMNDIPVGLIHLSDMALVERDDVREPFWLTFVQSSCYGPSSVVEYAIMSLMIE